PPVDAPTDGRVAGPSAGAAPGRQLVAGRSRDVRGYPVPARPGANAEGRDRLASGRSRPGRRSAVGFRADRVGNGLPGRGRGGQESAAGGAGARVYAERRRQGTGRGASSTPGKLEVRPLYARLSGGAASRTRVATAAAVPFPWLPRRS